MSVILTGKVYISPNTFELNKPLRIFYCECGIPPNETQKTPFKLTIFFKFSNHVKATFVSVRSNFSGIVSLAITGQPSTILLVTQDGGKC